MEYAEVQVHDQLIHNLREQGQLLLANSWLRRAEDLEA
jgi:hypothetical protein